MRASMEEQLNGHHDPYITLLRDWISKYNGINAFNKQWGAQENIILVEKGMHALSRVMVHLLSISVKVMPESQ